MRHPGGKSLTSVAPEARRREPAPGAFPALALAAAIVLPLAGCGSDAARVQVPGHPEASKSAATVRAERRAYDGAPPVIAHENFEIECTACHTLEGMDLGEQGFAPPMSHGDTLGMSDLARCRQCHVFQLTDGVFVASGFEGLSQDLRHGARLNPLSPPTIPHKTFMRENCLACHAGPAAREEIRTDHPERQRCRQCHVPVMTRALFETETAP